MFSRCLSSQHVELGLNRSVSLVVWFALAAALRCGAGQDDEGDTDDLDG